jgi:hypothetical protein
VSGLVSTPGNRDITGSKLEDLTMNYPYSKMCQADGKHVSTKRHSYLTYKISIKNNIIIIIIIRDTGCTILILTLYPKRRAYCHISKLDFCGADRT